VISINLLPPTILLRNLGQRARERRLEQNLSRKTLGEKAGISSETIKLFERTGRIGLESLVSLAIALDSVDEIELLFKPRPIRTLADARVRKRVRGRR